MKTKPNALCTLLYPMPLAIELEIQPERAVVKFGLSRTVDIGVLCFPKVPTAGLLADDARRLIANSPPSPARTNHVRQLLMHISAVAASGSFRMPTLHDHYSRLSVFVRWADANRLADVLANETNARIGVRAYLDHMRDRVSRNDISLNAGAKQHNTVVQILGDFLEIDGLGWGLNLLRRDLKTGKATSTPSELAQGRLLSLCISLFHGLADFVLEKCQYPYSLPMPSYLNFPNDRLWVFPAVSWFKTPDMVKASIAHAGYDYEEGRLATIDELRVQYPLDRRTASVTRDKAKVKMDIANKDPFHSSRWQLASQAMNAYMVMFVADTAMNWAQVVSLKWSTNYDIVPSAQGFRSVKWRAGGKTVSFELPVSSLPAFKRYLVLRSYLLEGLTCDYLFFTSAKAKAPPRAILSNLNRVFPMLRRIDANLSKVLPRAWRAAKSDWLIRKSDISTASLLLQNSEATVRKHYASGSESLHHEEMSDFLTQVANKVLRPSEELEGATERAVGKCAGIGKPISIEPSPVVKPDCVRPEGCLFCDKLKVHADETDTKKLLSCRYVIAMVAPMTGSEEMFALMVQPAISRIDEIVSYIAAQDPEMVSRVTKEIDEDGELDPYWSAKADMLMTLGF